MEVSYYQRNKDKILTHQRNRRQMPEVKQQQRKYARAYYQQNKNKIKQRELEKAGRAVVYNMSIEKRNVVINFD